MNLLDKIEQYAREAHGTQVRKFEDLPYITHLVRVKNLCSEYTNNTCILVVAILHDVLEDTPVTAGELHAFLRENMIEKEAAQTVELVIELTDVFTKDKYPQWNRRKRKQKEAERISKISAPAQTVKYADILDNSQTLSKADDSFVQTYLRESLAILRLATKGDQRLHQRVMLHVTHSIGNLPA